MRGKRFISLLLSAVMMISTAIPAAAAGPDTLQNQVLNLKFEENLNDESGKGNNGTIRGTAAYVDGVDGKALQFNGSTYVDLGTSTDLQPENLTVSFWLKPNSTMTGEQLITWNKNEWYTDGWYVSCLNDSVPLAISIGPAAANGQPYQIQVPDNRATFFPVGEWTHIVITYDRNTKDVKVYRNAVECGTTIAYSISGAATGVLGSDASMQKSLGWNGPKHNTTSLKAALDEYQLYNDVATAEEVIALYEAGGGTFDKKAIAQADLDALSLPTEIRSNLNLVSTGASGSVITWESSNTAVITNDGKVTRPAEGQDDVQVTLTATASYAGGEAVTKTFYVTVTAPEASSGDLVLKPNSVMGNVTLADDYLVNAYQKEVDYLLSMDSEKFLYEFYRVAGLSPTTSSGYGGWERTGSSNFRGHTFGHYMSALSQAYLSSDDADDRTAMLTEMSEAVNGLLACQEAYAAKYPAHAGYISAFPQGVLRRVDGVASPTADDGTVLVPYYNLHKVLAGLVDIAKNVDDPEVQQTALTVAEGFGEFLYNRMLQLTNQNAMLSIEYGGINEALYELYRITGNDHFKTAAQYFDEKTLFQQLANNQDVLNGKHANTTIPKLTSAVKRYTVLTGNDEYYNALTESEKNQLDMYLTAGKNFFDIVVNHHTYVTGGNSQSEHFRTPDALGHYATLGSYDSALTCETCNTHNMLKLSKALFEVTKDKKYIDYFENTYINAILSSQNPETGTTMYFQPMAPGYNKVFNRPHDEFWCCTGTGMENFSKLGDNIYYSDGSNVYVHMFFSSEYTDAANNLKLTQTANMPNEDTVTFTVAAANGESVKEGTVLRLRKPDWLAGEAEIKVNGKAITLNEQNGYYVIEAKTGDEITYKMPMEVVAYDMPDNPNMVAFKYGPVVLSTGLGTDNITRSAANGILVRVGTLDTKAKTTILMENYTDIEEWKADVTENLVRIEDSEDGQVQFKLQNTDSPELTYTPHYMRYKESYGLYMFIEGEDSQAAQDRILSEKEKLRDEEVSTDSLYTFDNNNYEFAKNLQASSNSSVGTYNGRQYRDAMGGGWFSYDLKVDQDAAHNYLNMDFYSGDRSRRFTISIDGTQIESYAFGDAPSGNAFFTHTIEIPADIVEAADDGNVTVRFDSVNNSLVGGLFGISVTTGITYSTDAAMKALSFDKGTLSPAFDGNTTDYTLTVPKGTESVSMTATPNVGSGLIYVNGVLIDDTQERLVKLIDGEASLRIVSKAQNHTTSKSYEVTIVTEGQEKPKVLAMFDFDDEETGFTNGYAVAEGNHTLQNHDDGKALYLDGSDDFLTVTRLDGSSLLTNVKEMTISFQAKPTSSNTNWAFYAAPNVNTQVYPSEHYLGALIRTDDVMAERYNNDNGRPATATASTRISDWTFVTIVHTTTETILYINGAEAARQSSEYDLRDILGNNSILYIGKANWEAGEYYRGLIDNYAITGYAMTADEVAELVANGGIIEEEIEVKEFPFTDVKEGDWFYTAVYNNFYANLMTGVNETTFAPFINLTRAQMAQILYNMENKPAVEYTEKFPDVADGEWFTDAVLWAAENGVVSGYAHSGEFDPHGNITREQAASMMYRYAGFKGYDVEVSGDLGAFADGESVSDWAEVAMQWAVGKGIITGKENGTKLDPQGQALRAECAVIIDKFMSAHK